MKTDRTMSTATGREESTSKKVGSTESVVGGEMYQACCRGEGALIEESVGGRGAHGNTQGEPFLKDT